ncbi:MAG: lipopolysaccharide core heptose(I) kinase RfaP [Planctomycetota bacterium]|jgi:hypothetical protein
MPPEWRTLASGIWHGTIGITVRCVPTRRTVAASDAGHCLFGKWRVGRFADARAEWRWLGELPVLGLRTPARVAWLGDAERSLVITRAADGRALLDWGIESLRDGWAPQCLAYACREVAPRVRALHNAGLFYRDLYWNHVFAADPRGTEPPTFLDVERVFRPRWRRRRWLVKDLAGLLSSAPPEFRGRPALRFLRVYCGGSLRGMRGLIVAVRAKADRILAHRPRYG